MKNIMFAKIRNEIGAGRFQYPSKAKIADAKNQDLTPFYHKMIGEWKDLEQEVRMGINKRIEAPAGNHDDVCCSDALANFAAEFGGKNRLPKPTVGRMYR
ncbi:hypothetical protein D3C75_1139960 [compost metagenome]